MRNAIISFVLIGCFIALGSGALRAVHDASHARLDRATNALTLIDHPATPMDPHPQHDETNCFIHAQLGQPLDTVAWTPLLISLGLLIAFLTLLAPQPVESVCCSRLACRGPPAAC